MSISILCVGDCHSFRQALVLLEQWERPVEDEDVYSELCSKAKAILSSTPPIFHVVSSLDNFPVDAPGVASVDMVLYANSENADLEPFLSSLRRATRRWLRDGLKVSRHALSVVHIGPPPRPGEIYITPPSVTRLFTPVDSRALAAKLLFLVAEVITNGVSNPWVKRKARALKGRQVVHSPSHYGLTQNALGAALCELLSSSGKRWMFASYTGAVVANMIEYVQHYRRQRHLVRKVPMVHGNSEHALACNALAFSQLHDGVYWIAVTIGMMLDFKGTLLNLVRSRAKGVIVCGEGEPSLHYGCQSMITPAEDVRVILSAMRIPFIEMMDVESLPQRWADFVAVYAQANGPVVILASPRALDATTVLDVTAATVPRPVGTNDHHNPISNHESVQALRDRLEDPSRDIVFVVDSKLSGVEHLLLQRLSLHFAVGVADSVQRPGVVSRERVGQAESLSGYPNYVGTVGIYGTSPSAYRLLFEGGKPRERTQLTLCFLDSKVDQPASPYTVGDIKNAVDIFQVTPHAEEMNPHISNHIQSSVEQCLVALLEAPRSLKPFPDLSRRMAAISSCQQYNPDPMRKLSTAPMSPNHFFYVLCNTLRRQSQESALDYVTVFDAGRFGFSALRNVPRVRPGFSGVYGRGAMGDAIQSLPVIALTHPLTIAFTGDGARALVPDLSSMLMRTLSEDNFDGALIVLTALNGTMSMIQTYQERGMFCHASAQVEMPVMLQQPSQWQWAGVNYHRVNMLHFDPGQWRQWCQSKRAVFFVDVLIEHNNADDIYTHLMPNSWWTHE